MYNAAMVTQLAYGRNSLQMTPSMVKRAEAFQMRGVRYILGTSIDHAYHSHVSNEEVVKRVNIARPGNDMGSGHELERVP